jgi:hypothetical protein
LGWLKLLQGIVTRLLQEEIDKGFIRGPFSKPPFKQYRVSPLGIATQKYSKKQRLILDLSSSRNNLVTIPGLFLADNAFLHS